MCLLLKKKSIALKPYTGFLSLGTVSLDSEKVTSIPHIMSLQLWNVIHLKMEVMVPRTSTAATRELPVPSLFPWESSKMAEKCMLNV